jgi:hypothetical protein
MNQPRRFKTEQVLNREGRLMALGSLEVPDPEAKREVARRLGISTAALASAAATTAIAPSAAAAAAASSSGGVGSLSAAVGKATGSFIATTLAKATVVGLSLGIASYAGVRLVRSRMPTSNPQSTIAIAAGPKLAQRTANDFGAAPATSSSQDRMAETASAPTHATSSGNPAAAAGTAEPSVPSDSLSPAAASVGRFEDVEPPAPLASVVTTTNESLTGLGPLGSANSAARTGPLPVDPRLAREVRSLDLARAYANRRNAAAALQELNSFERNYGYIALRKEAMLVHIDVLLSLGRRREAAAIARQLLLAGAPATRRASLEALVNGQPQ